MTEDDLAAIEQLLSNRDHLIPPTEDWSAGMTKAMLDKIPELLLFSRQLLIERERMVEIIKKDIGILREQARNWAMFYKGLDARPEQCQQWGTADYLEGLLTKLQLMEGMRV